MRVQTKEWQKFIPGVRMYKEKKTLFWNGELLWDRENREWLDYDWQERNSWKAIIILPGVEIIPRDTFCNCENVEVVIMADTVRRIECWAFSHCKKVAFVKLSTSLEHIAIGAFFDCTSLTSIFIPPSCEEVLDMVFQKCSALMIFVVPPRTELEGRVIANTALIKESPFETDDEGCYANRYEVNQWIKTINWNNDGTRQREMNEKYSLHRACSSFNPLEDIIFDIVKRQGLTSFYGRNSIGITPLQYLEANPYSEVKQKKIINRYVLAMMGEIVM
ncbi:hypothetical protein CTEN210_00834 [Chaetoceros tenuissimus]|uniref:Leucine-rich repeat domain-containing protein n=1 Tax=Chaetoceros tenuissimus TaxID=426638 RepID=A0AAD3GZ46_9STRA|nr:hypothetical protein CTEN210_00834 [Chaetoceros tenuissimus]